MATTVPPAHPVLSVLPPQLTSRPQRRWSDGPSYAGSLALEDEWSVNAQWPALVGALCEEIARGTESIARLEAEGKLHGAEAEELFASMRSMRASGRAMQQIVRLGAGGFRPCPERIDLARLTRQIAHGRLREFLRCGAEIGFDIQPAEVLMDGSVAERLVNVALDWALSFSRKVRLRIDSDGLRSVRLVVRATLPHAETSHDAAPSARKPHRERRMNDNLHWVLLRQLAAVSHLAVSRSSSAATESAVIDLPGVRALPGTLAGATAPHRA